MTSTPLWVPLVVAGIGILGVVAASVLSQVMSGIREDQRWRREREAEERRWLRERDERLAQWQREDESRWLRERRDIYAKVSVALNAWTATVDEGLTFAKKSHTQRWSPEMEKNADELFDAFEEVFEGLKLVGSPALVEKVAEIAKSYKALHHGLAHGEPGPLASPDRWPHAASIYAEMRRDLLVDGGGSPAQRTPSPVE